MANYVKLMVNLREKVFVNKQEVFDFVAKLGIWHEVTEHEAVFSMEEAVSVELPYPERDAKNLFVRDDKKRNYYLITVCGPKRVQLKEFQKAQGTRRLSFASAGDLKEMLDVLPGSVSPLGLLNNEACNVKLFLDGEFVRGSGIIGIHPNENTATIWLKAEDLMKMIIRHGNKVQVVEL